VIINTYRMWLRYELFRGTTRNSAIWDKLAMKPSWRG